MAETQQNMNSTVSWVALIFAFIALVLAWAAFNRSGTDVGTVVNRGVNQAADEVQEVTNEVQQEWDEFQIEARLIALRARIEARENLYEVQAELVDIRTDVQVMTANVSVETRQELQELDRELETLEGQVRDNSADALGTLENAIESARMDVRTDEDNTM